MSADSQSAGVTAGPAAGSPGPPQTAAWFHCFSGIAGDMALGSLLDAGADLDELVTLLRRLPLAGWSLEAEPVSRGGIAATRAVVTADDQVSARTARDVAALVASARLPERVAQRCRRVLSALADVEGRLHRQDPDEVHLHEVGAIDAVIDVVGTCAALELLSVDEVHASPVATGVGTVHTLAGLLPNPAPAVTELLRGAPVYGVNVPTELTTPTGAALLAGLVTSYGPLPALTITASGFGAGSAELDALPNVTQVVVGEVSASSATPKPGQPSVLLEVNVDDVTGEVLADAIAALLDAGAHDAWVTPIVMKKGRPAHTVSVLADPSLADKAAAVLTAETGSLGVRGQTLQRWPSARESVEIDVEGLPVRVKVARGRVKIEYDDAARVARVTGLPLREVLSRAEATWRERQGSHLDSAPTPKHQGSGN